LRNTFTIRFRKEEQAEEPTIYFFEEVIRKIEHAQQLLAQSVKKPISGKLERVRDAIRRSEYREAVTKIGEINFAELEKDQLLELFEAAWSAARGLNDNSEGEIRGYDLVVSLADRLEQHGRVDSNVRERAARAQFFKAFTLGLLSRSEEAIAAYDQVINRFAESSEPALQAQVASALFNEGITLGSLSRREEEMAAYDQVINRFGESKDPALQPQVAKALVNKGYRLGALNRHEEEIAGYDKVINRFAESRDPALQAQVALFNKGVTLGALSRNEEEMAAYDQVINRFGESKEPALQEQVAKAQTRKAFKIKGLKESDDQTS
jgi:tetratricopeptide (TPR) repeat protein